MITAFTFYKRTEERIDELEVSPGATKSVKRAAGKDEA
jgi:hypothetical protein